MQQRIEEQLGWLKRNQERRKARQVAKEKEATQGKSAKKSATA